MAVQVPTKSRQKASLFFVKDWLSTIECFPKKNGVFWGTINPEGVIDLILLSIVPSGPN